MTGSFPASRLRGDNPDGEIRLPEMRLPEKLPTAGGSDGGGVF